MRKKVIAVLLAVFMAGSTCAVYAEEMGTEAAEAVTEAVTEAAAQADAETDTEAQDGAGDTSDIILAEDDPDFSSMTIEEWGMYEFNKDYDTIIADITSYDHDFLRSFLDSHWSTYLELGISDPSTRTVSDEEARERLTAHHNMRMEALESVNQDEVEARRIYLWPRGQVPSVTEYTENEGYAYADWPDFEPYMLEMLVDEGTEVKGAVLLASGGGHMYRSNVEEAYEVALALNDLGYQCFIVNYRVDPYTLAESGLDMARAVRYVRSNAEKYGIEEDKIACAGFSAGGSVSTEMIDNWAGDVNASALVEGYEPDELDQVSADVNAYLSIYGNYNTEAINTEEFPPTFFVIGGEDGWQDVSLCFNLVKDAGIQTEIHVFAGVPHGFGAGTHADGTVYENASTWPALADAFMQDAYANAEEAAQTAAEEAPAEDGAAAEETTEGAQETAEETTEAAE